MTDYQTLFFELYNGVTIPNNQLLKICRDPKTRRLLLKQRQAITKAFYDYLEAVRIHKPQPTAEVHEYKR